MTAPTLYFDIACLPCGNEAGLAFGDHHGT